MRTKPLGKDGPQVPVICFGTFPLGGGFGAIPRKQAISTVHAALDSGLTFIDTAEGYSDAEPLLGEALKGRRDEVFLATKLSRSDHSPDQIDAAIKGSLKALQTDYIDLYQIHGPRPKYPIEQTLERFVHHRDAGNIRYFGISNFTAEQTHAAAAYTPISSSQPRYSMLFRDVEEGVLPACLEDGIGVIAHSVLAKGLLAGKYRPGHEFDKDDQRHDWGYYHGDDFDRIFAVAEQLKEWAFDHDHDLFQLALAWPLAHPSMTSSIVGVRTPEQAQRNGAAGDWELTTKDLAEIEEIQGDLRLHYYHGPDKEYHGHRDEGDPGSGDGGSR